MRLLNLNLKYFKGIKNFTMDTQGGNVDVYGDNATGKTTIADAVSWLLFDKDTQNKKDFAIKTLDKDGNVIHGLDHSVEAIFDLGNRNTSLCKVYSEQWTKKRGSATKEFTGHTTDYFIDSVPVKKKEYDAYIAEICSEDIFRLLTNPGYFNEQLHWEKRRQTLLEVCGDLTDEEVIASNPALAELPTILGNHTLEDYRKIIAARRTKINDELKKIPVRIDEVAQGLPDLSEFDGNDLQADIDSLRGQIREKEQELSRIEGGGEIAEKRVQLKEIESDLIALKNQLQGKISEQIEAERRELQEIKSQLFDTQTAVKNKQATVDNGQKQIERIVVELEELRNKWHQVNDQQFSLEQENTCPTCGQALPVDQLQAAREKALATFNRNKADHLEKITLKGKESKDQIETIQEGTQALCKEISKAEDAIDALVKKESELSVVIENMMKDANAYQEDPSYIAKLAEKESLEAEIAALQANTSEAKMLVNETIADLTADMRTLEKALSQVDQYEKGQQRIQKLSDQERDLATEYEKLEGELYLTEQFVIAKVNLLEEKINSKFKLARFKLFNVLVNGGVEECCETLYNGVPYSGGLNNAARINVGLDIINTLSEHYGFSAPIFIDNAEAVTELIETRGQIIRLVVSENDKVLRVETEGEQTQLFKEVV